MSQLKDWIQPRAFRIILILSAALIFLIPGIPLKVLLTITLANLALRENFPFSNFPMYSGFRADTFYLFITDQNDNQVATLETLGVTAPYIKKFTYVREMIRDCSIENEARKILLGLLELWCLQLSSKTPHS